MENLRTPKGRQQSNPKYSLLAPFASGYARVVQEGGQGLVLNNSFTANAVYGVYCAYSTSPTIQNNICTGNGVVGIYLNDTTGATLGGNSE